MNIINFLVYGTGNTYLNLKKFIKWDKVKIIAFLETERKKKIFEGYPVYTPEECLNKKECFDYILCASIYEKEMRVHLKELQVEEAVILSGKAELNNLLRYPEIFDKGKIIAYQNEALSTDIKAVLTEMKKERLRNRFYDMSQGITWLKELSLAPGGWAVDYDYMYIMVRILCAKKPKSILEMGLGQSSKILGRYQQNEGCAYDIVEQDEEWNNFFRNELDISNSVKIHICPMKQIYNPKYQDIINCYENFQSVILEKKYDFISIDGPWGGRRISRIDILPYIPQCLESSFSIMVDDYEREGEKNMIIELEDILARNQIEYNKYVYGLEKLFCLITSKDNSFVFL